MKVYEKLSYFLREGVPELEAISILAIREKKKNRSFLGHLFSKWRLEVGTQSLAEAIAPWVPGHERILILSGSDPAVSFRNAFLVAEGVSRIKKAIFSSLMYPLFLLGFVVGVVIWISFGLVPMFESIVPFDQWTGLAKLLASHANFLRENIVLLIILMVLSIVFLLWSFSNWTGLFRDILNRFFPYAIYRDYQGATVLLAVSAQMSAGVPFFTSIDKMINISSPWVRYYLQMTLRRLKSGINEGSAMDTGLFSVEISGDIQDFSRLKSFHSAISIISQRVITVTIDNITMVMNVFRTICLILVTIVIIWVYLSFAGLTSQILKI